MQLNKMNLNNKKSRKWSNVIGTKISLRHLMNIVTRKLKPWAAYYQSSIIKFEILRYHLHGDT